MIKKFESFNSEDFSREKAVSYINSLYPNGVESELDEQVYSGDWLDTDWQDDGDGYDDEWEWYREYGRGEAEDSVVNDIMKQIKKKFNISSEEYLKLTGEEMWETIKEVFPILDTLF